MTSNRWVVTADERVARLVHVERNERGRLCVEDQAMITDAWEEHEHGRPSPLSREGGGTYASIGHEQETRLARFAKEIAEWLERELAERGVDQIAVFAPPHFLGALRKAWTPRFALQVEEQQGDLARLTPAQLADEAMVADLVAEGGGIARPR